MVDHIDHRQLKRSDPISPNRQWPVTQLDKVLIEYSQTSDLPCGLPGGGCNAVVFVQTVTNWVCVVFRF
jgi:hypothetical protein